MIVVDTAAVLAFLFGEAGGAQAQSRFSEAMISSVNVTETISKMTDRGVEFEQAIDDFGALDLRHVAFDQSHALLAARLRTRTAHRGLSLGDRACLALAILENATALTADRAWADLDVGCEIELIR